MAMKLYALSQRIDKAIDSPVDRLGYADLGFAVCDTCDYSYQLCAGDQDKAYEGTLELEEECPQCAGPSPNHLRHHRQ